MIVTLYLQEGDRFLIGSRFIFFYTTLAPHRINWIFSHHVFSSKLACPDNLTVTTSRFTSLHAQQSWEDCDDVQTPDDGALKIKSLYNFTMF